MSSIQTFVFIDFATERGNENVLYNLCLLPVPRQQFLEPNNTTPPQDLFIVFSDNEINEADFHKINDFINRQEKPVCIFAHYGNKFDFIILRRQLNNLNKELASDVFVADCIYAFHDILENRSLGKSTSI